MKSNLTAAVECILNIFFLEINAVFFKEVFQLSIEIACNAATAQHQFGPLVVKACCIQIDHDIPRAFPTDEVIRLSKWALTSKT